LAINTDILNTLIRNQKNAIHYQTLFALVVVCVGICLILLSVFVIGHSGEDDTIKLITGIGGGFISTISAFPVNQIITRNERIRTYKYISVNIDKLSNAEKQKAEELIWESIEKIF
jgi:fluoride ion exporter CrcB/FEX